MLSQTVLLAGRQRRPEVLGQLMRGFVETRIKPYYLHHGDFAPGTAHLRASIGRGPGADAGPARAAVRPVPADLRAGHPRRPRQGADRARPISRPAKAANASRTRGAADTPIRPARRTPTPNQAAKAARPRNQTHAARLDDFRGDHRRRLRPRRGHSPPARRARGQGRPLRPQRRARRGPGQGAGRGVLPGQRHLQRRRSTPPSPRPARPSARSASWSIAPGWAAR